jgi:ElaB/YqjD/DUF883 family membrane-anchored ribosome-binding protein
MRLAAALTLVAIFCAASVRAGEKDLLDKFKKQNNSARDRLEARIKQTLEQAKELQKEDPVTALGMLQEVRDRMLQKGLLTSREDRALAEPLWERIQALREIVRGKRAGELRASLAEFKEYLNRMNEQFGALRTALIPPTVKETPRGWPAFIALTNGKYAVGWLHEAPVFVVSATVADQEYIYGPGLVAGVQTPEAFYVFAPATQRFSRMTNPEFFVTAIATDGLGRQRNFWVPTKEIEPPPGYDRRSAGAVGLGLFARSAAALMTRWANPASGPNEAGKKGSTDTMRQYRDALIELHVQDVFAKLPRADQEHVRDAIIAFLERRPADAALTPDERMRVVEIIVERFADRRADAQALANLLNRFMADSRRERERPK